LFAGYGITRLSQWIRIRGVLWALVAATVLESGWITVRVLTGTRNAFADVREAGEYLASADFQQDLKRMGIPEDTPIYSNETYNQDYKYPVKLRFWSGRRDIQLATSEPKGGYILCWHNVYAGSPTGIAAFESFCNRTGAKEIHPPFVAVNIPRLPTIMVDPFPYSTSMPRAMEHREVPQRYETRIVYVPETKPQVSGTSARLGIQ
jgi:hypothetical protein